MSFAMIGFAVVVGIGIFLYFRPGYIREGFEVAVDRRTFPKCVRRDPEAEQLITSLKKVESAYTRAALEELTLILEKILCMEADLSGPGRGVNNTLRVAYATSHDLEPAGSIVGRCLRGGMRNNELQLTIKKYEDRGNELIDLLCADKYSKQTAFDKFHSILTRNFTLISQKCEVPRVAIDVPTGPRDPGYNIPYKTINYSEFKPAGGDQYM